MQDGQKAVWSIPYISLAFFPSLKQNFIAYRSSKVSSRPDCIFEIHQLWQSGFSKVYFNSCGSCSFECEIIKIGQSSHKMYSNNIVNFQESTTISNASTKKSLGTYWMHHVNSSLPGKLSFITIWHEQLLSIKYQLKSSNPFQKEAWIHSGTSVDNAILIRFCLYFWNRNISTIMDDSY